MNTNYSIASLQRNQTVEAQSFVQLAMLRSDGWKLYQQPAPHLLEFPAGSVRLRPGLTFTPFANPVRCNAHCAFCSEELVRKGGHRPTAQRLITGQEEWLTGLRQVLRRIAILPKGFSLSGLEATADPDWLLAVLAVMEEQRNSCRWDEKVLYTNGSGLLTHTALLPALAHAGFDRMELSRCHWDAEVNQRIMRFNRNQPVWTAQGYGQLVRQALAHVSVRNSCILTQAGVASLPDVEQYLHHASQQGVTEVVFRELSRMGDAYEPNVEAQWIERHRVPIETLLDAVWSVEGCAHGWEYRHSTLGYYYYNEHYLWRGKVKVVLETSSYPALMRANASGVVNKLVYHSNGNLCGDWDPDNLVLGTYPHGN